MVTHSGTVQYSIAEADRLRTPWWYRYVKSWRWRMWLETGVWVPRPFAKPVRHLIPEEKS